MGYLLAILTAVLSIFAYLRWSKVVEPWLRHPGEISDAVLSSGEWPSLVAWLLPRSLRRAWSLVLIWTVTFAFGIPHWLVVRRVLKNDYALTTLVPYALTLAWWLLLLGYPALMLSSDRLARQAKQTSG